MGVEGERRVGEGDGLEGGVDQVGWVIDEVFGRCHGHVCCVVFYRGREGYLVAKTNRHTGGGSEDM